MAFPAKENVPGMIRKVVFSIRGRKACGSILLFKLFRKEEK